MATTKEKQYEVTTIATNFSYPHGIARRKDGSFLVSDQNHNLIKKLTPIKDGTYEIAVFAGGQKSGCQNGTLEESLFHFVGSIALDTEENLYVCDSWNHCIRMISGENVTTFLPKTFKNQNEVVSIKENRAMTIDRHGEFLYFVDSSGRLYKIVIPSALCVASFDIGGIGGLPRGLALDDDNNLYYTTASEVIKVDSKFQNPQVICKVSDGRGLLLNRYCTLLYIGSNTGVFRYNFASKVLTELCKMDWAIGMSLDRKGNMLVCEYNTGSVKSIKLGGAVPWSQARIVWIGHMKNHPTNSHFARLPKEIVKEILMFCNDYY